MLFPPQVGDMCRLKATLLIVHHVGYQQINWSTWIFGGMVLISSPTTLLDWPSSTCEMKIDHIPEERKIKTKAHSAILSITLIDIKRFSSLSRLVRSFAFCLRFIDILRKRRVNANSSLQLRAGLFHEFPFKAGTI